jgi:hypothetical protein
MPDPEPRDSRSLSPAVPAPVPIAAARERAIGRLKECYARDDLSMEEYEGRVTAVYDAATVEALAALTVDLPDVGTAPSPARAAPFRIAAVLSNFERAMSVVVPAELEIRAWLGNVEIDLRGARFSPGVTEIALDNFMGNIEIQLPAGTQVENFGTSFLSNFECQEPRGSPHALASATPAAIVRFTGRTVLGNVTVVVG